MNKLELNKKIKRDSLLESAFSLFTSKGINKTSISDIVQQSGVAKGTFYLYFKDKYDLRNMLIAKKACQLFRKADDVYELHCPAEGKTYGLTEKSGKLSLAPFFAKIKSSDIYEAETILLPYVAWLRNNKDYKNFEYKDLLKLALDSIVSYNI